MLRRVLLTFFLILFLLTPALLNNTVSAAEACLKTKTASGQFIQYTPVDAAGSTLLQIPEGITSLNIRISNLEDGFYRLALINQPKFALAYTEAQHTIGGVVTLTIPDPNSSLLDLEDTMRLLQAGSHSGNLQFSQSNDFNDVKIPKPYNPQYCEDVKYTIGFPKESCTLTTEPAHPASNQQFLLNFSNAPAGTYGIVNSGQLIPTLFTIGPAGIITINNNGKATSELIGPLGPGKYQIALINYAFFQNIDQNIANGLTAGISNYINSFMCQKDIEVVVANTGPPLPTCALMQLPFTPPGATTPTGIEYKLRAFNLNPSTNYDVTLDEITRGSTSLGSQNSGTNNRFDVSLLNGASSVSSGPGQYTGSIKDAAGAGCGVSFSLDSAGNFVPGSASTIRLCRKGDNNPLCSQSGSQTCTPPFGEVTSGIPTAIGCVPTDPIALIKAILAFITAISGGLALLLMIISAFEMITAAGNPDSLANARDRFIKAIEGLLFVLFAVVLLRIIGVDILGLGKFFGL